MTEPRREPSPGAEASAVTTAWGAIPGPGSYVSRRTGRLLRVPPSMLEAGYGPVIPILGMNGEEIVTRLSSDAYEPVANLRRLAAGASIAPAF